MKCKTSNCSDPGTNDGYCRRCWEEINGDPVDFWREVDRFSSELLDNPKWIKLFIRILLIIFLCLILTQAAIKLGLFNHDVTAAHYQESVR